jgi:exopolysaccharide biosynthesis polyprenyl glycosylphosphotransferase
MLKENARLFALAQRGLDATVVALAFAIAYVLEFRTPWLVEHGWIKPHGAPEPLRAYALALPVAVLAVGIALELAALYEPRRTRSPLAEGFAAARASLAAIVPLLAIVGFTREFSRAQAGLFAAIAPALLALERGSVRAFLSVARRRGWNVRRALVVGQGPLAEALVARLRANPWTGIEVVGVLHLDPVPPPDPDPDPDPDPVPVPVLGSYRQLREIALARGIDQVFLALPLERAPLLRELRELTGSLPIDVRLVPDTADFLPIRPSVSELDGLPIVTVRQAPAAGVGAAAKRAVDIVGAFLGLVLLAPLLAFIAALVRLLEGGPVLYRQERVGWGGRPFLMVKFRTMVADAEAVTGPTRTKRNDPRCTRLGALLRRTSLDELPQLWNVLKGDMSLVGPRPERPEFLGELRARLPDYMLRLTVKAGMTGLAQVHGLRGDSSVEERLQMDLDYVRTWSLRLDLKILALTLVRGFVHENAF